MIRGIVNPSAPSLKAQRRRENHRDNCATKTCSDEVQLLRCEQDRSHGKNCYKQS